MDCDHNHRVRHERWVLVAYTNLCVFEVYNTQPLYPCNSAT